MYCVNRILNGGGQMVIARGIETIGEAAEVALRLYKLQEHLGGLDEFQAEEER